MLALFWRTFKDRRTLLVIYTLASIAILWMYVALFPSFKNQSASLEALIKNYPESFLKAFNFDIKSFTTIEGFLATEQFSFMWPILSIFMIVGYAGYAIAGEIEKGTIEFLLSQPLSRFKIFLVRYLVGLKMFFIYTIFSTLAPIPLARFYGISYHSENFLMFSFMALIFGLAIYSLAMFCSSVFSDKGKVFFLTGVLLVLMYILNILSSIKDNLADLKYASFFYYYDPAKVLTHNEIDHWAYLVFGGIFLVFTVLGFLVFRRRDISV